MKRQSQEAAFALRVDAGNRQKRRRLERAGREIQNADLARRVRR